MAGDKQHILPKFLLKGFASRVIAKATKQDEVMVWVYPKGRNPYECNTRRVNAETHFYGKAGELSADDDITDIEYEFAIALDELRARDDGYRVDDRRVLEFITHLTARTKHLRDSIIDAYGFLTDNLFGYFSDYGNWKAWCIEHLKRHPEVIKNTLDEATAQLSISAYKKAMIRQKIKRMPVERMLVGMDKDQSQYEFLFVALKQKFAAEIDDIAKQAHIKALLKNLVSGPRLEHYRLLNWYVRKSHEPLILGDVGCIFELDGHAQFKSLGGTDDKILNVYLPISSDCLVVGTAHSEFPRIDFTAINEAVARCSREFFICSIPPSPETTRLAALIGEESEMISKEEMVRLSLK